ANNSKIVLRWEIDNCASISLKNLPSCAVFKQGGFEWKTLIRPNVDGVRFNFLITCDKKWRDWRCEADVKFVLHNRNSESNFSKKVLCSFHEGHNEQAIAHVSLRDEWSINNKVIAEFIIDIISSEDGFEPTPIDLSKFCSPCEANNVTLIIGDNKLRISKDYLALHSPVFASMFFGDFAEKGKDEVEIKDVIYEEFIDVLHVISPTDAQISDYSIVQILALGDRFQIQKIVSAMEKHLMTSYKLTNNRCLMTYSTVEEITTLKSTPEYAQFSDKMKVAICDRIMNLA
ncbi:hypothetical protein PMAYCL1PPCAC_25499, partial [Pristionchus mayeri]